VADYTSKLNLKNQIMNNEKVSNEEQNQPSLLGAVISQRELLIDFSRYLSRYYDIELLEIDVDGYFQEKSINSL
jgi:hypothetical protein